ncbi:hypothetical protein H2200_002915 [Cladophialophora chaetospira]|uniref:Zn(2)-C6 fungal-type domain-containing protein n=1 Tax=Cladophialophora chaetospira TaxID=386627 RepID=A0AA38XGF8_9EURO|nr:hypothetical protein H2200_002915 [Cladophialophora chaetospira]
MPQGKPYSSCDACRHSRIGCNLTFQTGNSCFNCLRKGINCTFSQSRIRLNEPNKAAASNKQRAVARALGSQRTVPAEPATDSTQAAQAVQAPAPVGNRLLGATAASREQDTLSRRQQALQLHQILWNLFTNVLEPRIGLWIGGSGCPFVESTAAPTTLISRLAITLDNETGPSNNATNLSSHDVSLETIHRDVDNGINRALTFSVYAYAVRWLSLGNAGSVENQKNLKRELSETLWIQARQQISAAMSKPTYRSILALYLFAIVPSSPLDQGSIKALCFDAALNHQNHLLSKAEIGLSNADPIAKLLAPEIYSPATQNQSYLRTDQSSSDEEVKVKADIMYWFGIILDTTRSLTRCQPSIVLPGRSGEVKVWSIIRKRTDSFEQQFRSLHGLRAPLDDSKVITILQHAFAFKILVWAAIIRVQDAVHHQVSGTTLDEALDAVRRDSNRFEEVFGPLLNLCQRDFIYLSRSTQMSYTLLNIHFQMATLILADSTPEAVVFTDADSNPYSLRLCSCRNIVNAVSLAMRTDVTSHDATRLPSLLLLDPYPDYMTGALARTGSSLFQLYAKQEISAHSVTSMFSTVIAALKILSEISHLAVEAIPVLQQKFSESGAGLMSDSQNDNFYQAAFSVASPVDENLLNAGIVAELEQQASNPALVDDTVVHNESNMLLSNFLTDDLGFVDFDFLSREWTLDECFSEPQ